MTKPVSLIAVIPAAGVGARMQANSPKQYLTIAGQTVLQHSVARLLAHPWVSAAVIAVSTDDPYFALLQWSTEKPVYRVIGGAERADSVLAGVQFAQQELAADWVLVHDAARPCLRYSDLCNLIERVCGQEPAIGGLLAVPVRDTMKRSAAQHVDHTVDRRDLWHAQTPQLFPAERLAQALLQGLHQGIPLTDEASALEWQGVSPLLVEGHGDNIKITHPEDLALARFYLQQELA